MYYLFIKSFHLIFLIAWMVALLYLPRLFVYHSGVSINSSSYKLLLLMEKRLIKIIAIPAMILTLLFGSILLNIQNELLYENYFIINLDKLTYASDFKNIESLDKKSNYSFIHGDVCVANLINDLFQQFPIDSIIHLAAESHVDNSIKNPLNFINTNILGTINLLETTRKYWLDSAKKYLFYNISTDEVYGSLGKEGFFTEDSSYSPNSPYSASKASADHFMRAYGKTYDLPFIISNCSNNYGPYQHVEKFIPMVIK